MTFGFSHFPRVVFVCSLLPPGPATHTDKGFYGHLKCEVLRVSLRVFTFTMSCRLFVPFPCVCLPSCLHRSFLSDLGPCLSKLGHWISVRLLVGFVLFSFLVGRSCPSPLLLFSTFLSVGFPPFCVSAAFFCRTRFPVCPQLVVFFFLLLVRTLPSISFSRFLCSLPFSPAIHNRAYFFLAPCSRMEFVVERPFFSILSVTLSVAAPPALRFVVL